MRVSRECLVKALNEGFKIWLTFNDVTVGNINEYAKVEIKAMLVAGVFRSASVVKKEIKCCRVVVDKKNKEMELVG